MRSSNRNTQPSHFVYGLAVLFLFLPGLTRAQTNVSPLKEKIITHFRDTIILDSMPIVPGSIIIKSSTPNLTFKTDYVHAFIIPSGHFDTLKVKYRTIPVPSKLGYNGQRLYVPDAFYYNPNQISSGENYNNLNQDINSEGSFARSIRIGTNGEGGTATNFNLKFSGKITENIDFYAALSNNSLPSQTDGTYSLQEFDKIFIKVNSPSTSMEAGDVATNVKSGFIKYNRQIKGITVLHKDTTAEFYLFAGTTKGVFNKITIKAQEGNQGPYRLYGKNGQTRILIIPGSEKIYLNGKLLQKGEQYDYTIDYVNAEITFTPNNIITRNSRIVAEFEYMEESFPKLAMGAQTSYRYKKTVFYVTNVTEKDIPDINQYDYNTLEKIAKAGDNYSSLIISTADSTGYSSEEIRYCKRDTTVDGQTYTIFEYSTNPQCAWWKVNFSYMGPGQGEYIESQSALNANVYKWVGPGKGDFMPQKQLLAPQKKTLWSLGTYTDFKFFKTGAEISLSLYDKNTLSGIDDNDNNSIATKLFANSQFYFKNDTVKINAQYSYIGHNFSYFDPFLPVEWQRDWNMDSLVIEGMHTARISAGFNHIIQTTAQIVYIPSIYSGLSGGAAFNLKNKHYFFKNNSSYTTTYSNNKSSNFTRNKGQTGLFYKNYGINVKYEAEKNVFTQNNAVKPGSYAFWQSEEFIHTGDTTKNHFGIVGGQRFDYFTTNNNLTLGYITRDYGLKYSFANKNYRSSMSLINHNNIIVHSDTAGSINSILGRFLFTGKVRGVGTTKIKAQSGKGAELVEQFYFVEVPAGQGQYTWIDFNNDGQKQLNEFQLTQFPDKATYIRIVLNSNKYIPVYRNKIHLSLKLTPHTNSKTIYGKTLNAFSSGLSAFYDIKATSFGSSFSGNYRDTNIISFTGFTTANTKIKISPNTEILHIYNTSVNKRATATGTDIFNTTSNKLIFKTILGQSPELSIFYKNDKHSSYSTYFTANNFDITGNYIGFEIQTHSRKAFANIKPQYIKKSSSSGDKLSSIQLLGNIAYNYHSNNLSLSIAFINNTFTGNEQSISAYRMLEGLQNGFNLTSDLKFSTQLMKNLYWVTTYSLRKSKYNFYQGVNFEIKALF